MVTKISDFIPVGEWLPDRQALDNQGAYVVQNVVPEGEDYKPFPDLSYTSNALPAACTGAYSFRDNNGNIQKFAGTSTTLHLLNSGTTWSNVSKAGNYTSQADILWSFANFGNRVLATNYNNNIQSYIVGTSSLFADLSVDAPRAKYITVFKEVVVVANTYDTTDGAVGNRVRWSGLNSPTQWTVGTNGSDYQDIQGYGAITGIKNMQDFVAIIMETGVIRMEYIGGTFVFSFRAVDQSIGSRAPNSIISNGINTFYYAENGFMMFDGLQSTPIGDNKIDKYFADLCDTGYLYQIIGAANPSEKYIIWHFRSVNSADGKLDKALVYSWASNRFSFIDSPCEYCFAGFTSGYTLDQLATLYSSIDAIPFSLDSPIWAGGKRILEGFDSSHRLGAFSGQNKAVTIETGEAQLNSQGRAVMYGIKPIVDTDMVTVSVGYRSRQGQTVTYTPARSKNTTTEECNFNVDSRYHRARLTIPAGTNWQKLKGIKVRAEATGEV